MRRHDGTPNGKAEALNQTTSFGPGAAGQADETLSRSFGNERVVVEEEYKDTYCGC